MIGKYEFHGNYYLVNDKGIVYGIKGNPLKQKINKDGYLEVELRGKYKNSKNNIIRYKVKVHSIVAKTFIPKPDGFNAYEVNHIDCCRTNNNLSNLEWMTHLDNIKYSIINGNHKNLKCIGENNIKSVLNVDDVLKIRGMYDRGMSIREIYRNFYKGIVSENTIGNVCKKRNWKHI